MMKNFFYKFEASTQAEREEMAVALKSLFFGALNDENETFHAHRQNKKSATARTAYFEAIQRVGAVQEVLEILGVDCLQLLNEYNEKNG